MNLTLKVLSAGESKRSVRLSVFLDVLPYFLVLGRILAISVVDLMKARCGPYERLGKKGT